MKWRRSDMTSPAFSKRGILSHAIGSTLRQFRLLPVVFLLVFALAIPCTLLDRSDMGWLGKEAMFYSQLSAYMLWFLLPAAGPCSIFSSVPGRWPLTSPWESAGMRCLPSGI